MLRGLLAALRPFTDDRGRKCALVRPGQVSTVDKPPIHWEYLAHLRDDLGLSFWVLIHMPSAGLLGLIGISGWMSWLVFLVMEVPVIMVLAPLVRRPFFYPLSHIYRHQVVSVGACASCGYALTGLPASPDGLLDCPECHACWRSDRLQRRVPIEGADLRRTVRSKLPEVLRLAGGMQVDDHRGNPAMLMTFRPGRSWVGEYGRSCRDAARSIQSDGDGRAAVVMVVCFVGVAIAMMIAMGINSGYGYVPWWGWGIVALVPALVLVGFVTGVSDLFVAPQSVERATLVRGLCPSCWELLRGLPEDADGCTMCPECGSAWRLPGLEADCHGPEPDHAPFTG